MRRLALLCALIFAVAAPAAPGASSAQDADQRLALRDADLVLEGTTARLVAVGTGGAATLAWRVPPESTLRAAVGNRRGFAAAGTVRVGGGRDLLLYVGDETGARRIAPPPSAARVRDWPVLLMGHLGLAGVAWLEGSDETSLAVRAARWNGAGWDAVETLAPGGAGSQLALTGARLADGSWLLAWSAFDGEDDEILWSRSRADGWTLPARVAPDNHVPDVTPVLAPLGEGAVVAWSHYDGHDYRVVAARFDGVRFAAPREIGPAGSVEPELDGRGDRAVLLYRNVLPAEWRAVELDRTGRAGAFAAARARDPERPALRLLEHGAELLWRSGAESLSFQGLP